MAASTSDEQCKREDLSAKTEGEEGKVKLSGLKPVVTREEKHDDPKPEAAEADEFGLPVRPPRRRGYSLEELESPEVVDGVGLDGVRLDGVEGKGETNAESMPTPNSVPLQSSQSETESVSPEAEGAKSQQVNGRRSQEGPSSSRPSSSHVPHAQPSGAASEWSHQQLAPHADEEEKEVDEGKWQQMPALAEHRIYDDWGKVIAKSYDEVDDGAYGYANLGGAGKGYTRVQMDEDAQSATSLDDNTAYLFKDQHARHALDEEDEEGRDLVSQLQTTKELLTEGQRMAYVGVVRLAISSMAQEMQALERTKGAKKTVELAGEMLKMWGQKIMVRLYGHMDISSAEQVMVEQLAEHGVLPSDLSPALMQNARVKNPKAESETSSIASARPSLASPRPSSTLEKRASTPGLSTPGTPGPSELDGPPAYEEHTADDFRLQDASELDKKNIDLDIRWTVLCDLFLLLIADSTYDARSRTLLERVGAALAVDWQEICRFEKRVTDALEMQEQADKENWNEEDHMKAREKRARNKRLMVMGLCTVGGGLVIGLSAGMLAPVIGAGLAAGFTTIGVAGTGGFLGGTGAAALIGTTGSLIGGRIGMKGANRRTGAVKTFEYRPLFNNKRVNLIVTVSGWMAGKVDDVRLPFSTVDPIMGDIYSVNWEPEMLQSTGQTIQILGTEALTQTIQQILGATFLATLMAGLSLPIVLTKLAYLIDNPWTVSLARADATGLILADSLIDRNLGVRPITLVGFSLGSRVIFSCLRELARRGALGLVQNAYLFGSPIVVKKDEWTRARTVVSGRFVNGYATGDWILAYLFRATAGGVGRVAGLATVEVEGVENRDVTADVGGHMAYRGMMPMLLEGCGWSVESAEFTEIEDPDPADHGKRQRELISEIEEARRELEEKPQKKGIKSFFTRRKVAPKKEWETYDEARSGGNLKVLEGDDVTESERVAEEMGSVMFDVEAIRREALRLALAGGDLEEIKGHLQIKEIEGTMPALKIASTAPPVRGQSNGEVESDGAGGGGGLGEGVVRGKSFESALPAMATGGVVGDGHSTPVRFPREDHEDDGRDRHADEEDITLEFETPDRPTYTSHASYTNGDTRSPFRHPSPSAPAGFTSQAQEVPRWDSPLAQQSHTQAQAQPARSPPHDASERPALRSVSTAPALSHDPALPVHQWPVVSPDHDHNPWAEDEDEAVGRERERGVEMVFE